MHNLDILFINPGNAQGIYQDLAKDYSAIEPPTWALLLAESVRNKGYKTAIFDVNAERISNEEAVERVKDYNPKLICFVVYGQNVNAGAVGMSGAVSLANLMKEENLEEVFKPTVTLAKYTGGGNYKPFSQKHFKTEDEAKKYVKDMIKKYKLRRGKGYWYNDKGIELVTNF